MSDPAQQLTPACTGTPHPLAHLLHPPPPPIVSHPSLCPNTARYFPVLPHPPLPSAQSSSSSNLSFLLHCPSLPTVSHTFSLILHLLPLLPPPQSLSPSCEPPPPIVTPPFSCSFTSCPVPPHTRPLAISPSLGIHLPVSLILLHLSSLPVSPSPPSVPPTSQISPPPLLTSSHPLLPPTVLPPSHLPLSCAFILLHIPTASCPPIFSQPDLCHSSSPPSSLHSFTPSTSDSCCYLLLFFLPLPCLLSLTNPGKPPPAQLSLMQAGRALPVGDGMWGWVSWRISLPPHPHYLHSRGDGHSLHIHAGHQETLLPRAGAAGTGHWGSGRISALRRFTSAR